MKKIDEHRETVVMVQRKRKILVMLVVAVVVVSGFGWWRKTAEPVAIVVPKTEVAEAARRTQKDPVVYVSGMVRNPGLIKLSAGARILDAVNAAGGLLPGAELAKVNLAQPVKDGMQVHVPGRPPEPETKAGSPSQQGAVGSNAAKSAAGQPEKININTADATELDRLPGVGPALAVRIVEYRRTHGNFASGDDLVKVPGLGPAKYEKIKSRITW